MKVKEEVEHEIQWQIKFKLQISDFDNWTKRGAVYFLEDKPIANEEAQVKDFILNGQWNREMLKATLSKEMVEYIIEHVNPSIETNSIDRVMSVKI